MTGFALGSEALRSFIMKENHSLENVKMENKCFFLFRLFHASAEHSSSQLRFKVTWLIGVRIRPPVVALNALHISSSSVSSEINRRGGCKGSCLYFVWWCCVPVLWFVVASFHTEIKGLSVFKNYEAGEPTCRLYVKNIAKQVEETVGSFLTL